MQAKKAANHSEIELFPVKKTQVHFAAPPEMIFFDAEEAEPDEAEFILLDDLYRMDPRPADIHKIPETSTKPIIHPSELSPIKEKPAAQTKIQDPYCDPHGWVTFTIIPKHRYQYIDAQFSRQIRRTLVLTAMRENLDLKLTRVRPVYTQWTVFLEPAQDAKETLTLFRKELDQELQTFFSKTNRSVNSGSFWAAECLIQPFEMMASGNQLASFVNHYQLL